MNNLKKVYMVCEESNEIYKGGISIILDSYFESNKTFCDYGYEIIRVNPFSYRIPKKPFFRKIVNVFRIKKEG